jgi:hypothetical protein
MVIEGLTPFAAAWNHYASWFQVPRTPHITMMESAIPLQIGYGYGTRPAPGKGSVRGGGGWR